MSKGHINAQYRRLNRFFNWLVERRYADENPLSHIEPPSVDERTVPIVTEGQIRDLLTLADPSIAETPAHRFRLVRDRALLYVFRDTPGRLGEIAKLRLDDVDLTEGTLLVMGKGRKERRMPIGDTARSVIWDYLSGKRVPRAPDRPAVGVRAGRCTAAQRDMPDSEALGEAGGNRWPVSSQVPPFLRDQRPEGWDAGADIENSGWLEEDTRDLLQDAGGRRTPWSFTGR